MTMSAPMPGEPVGDVDDATVASTLETGAHPEDRQASRRLWLLTIAVLVVALAATVAILTWQWLAPASGTVAR